MPRPAPTHGFDVIGGDGLAVLVDGAFGHDDDVEPGATQAGLGGEDGELEGDTGDGDGTWAPARARPTSVSRRHRWSSQSSSGGDSGMKTQSAPQARAVMRAR